MVNPFVWVKDKVVAVWAYSRTIVVNVVGVVILAAPELVNYLSGVDLEALVGHKWAVFVGLVLGALNILLRFYTVAAVGASQAAKQAAVNIVADVKEEEDRYKEEEKRFKNEIGA